MLGLAHRGYRLADYGHHLVHTLRTAGYASTLIGEQHLSVDPHDLGYDRIVEPTRRARATSARRPRRCCARACATVLLSVGPRPTATTPSPTCATSRPPCRRQTSRTRPNASRHGRLQASARRLDEGVGTVLDAGEAIAIVADYRLGDYFDSESV
jgi:hypothetical protein